VSLGLALWQLGERESGTARLEEAVAAYRDALKERTRERVPLDWAMTQMSLGKPIGHLSDVTFTFLNQPRSTKKCITETQSDTAERRIRGEPAEIAAGVLTFGPRKALDKCTNC
jgi:hypothetical protein